MANSVFIGYTKNFISNELENRADKNSQLLTV